MKPKTRKKKKETRGRKPIDYALELNQLAIRLELAKIDKSHAWLAAKIGITRQCWNWYYRKRLLKFVFPASKILKVKPITLVQPKLQLLKEDLLKAEADNN